MFEEMPQRECLCNLLCVLPVPFVWMAESIVLTSKMLEEMSQEIVLQFVFLYYVSHLFG